MLPFFSNISDEAHAADSLHVVARGLGTHNAAALFIASSVDDSSLILGMNITRHYATGILWPTLQSLIVSGGGGGANTNINMSPGNSCLLLPRFLNSDFSIRDREAVYAGAGFVVLTSAILVHDLLHNKLPTHRVRGVVIFGADAIKEKSNDHFALSLLRARNRTAFVKAFSDNAPALARGFHTVEKLMRMLYVSRLVLWPRFHHAVRNALYKHAPDLVDLAVQQSPRFGAMIAALRDTVHAVLSDLKKTTHAVDLSELYRGGGRSGANASVSAAGDANTAKKNPTTVGDAGAAMYYDKTKLVFNFDDVAKRHVLSDRTSHMSARVRALLADLTTLRGLLRDAFALDAVQFYQRVVTVRHAAHSGHSWLVRREAQPFVLMARSRVWVVRKRSSSSPSSSSSSANIIDARNREPASSSETPNPLTEDAADLVREPGSQIVTIPTLETCPKWTVLREILAEIRDDVHTAGAHADVGRVLIVVRDARTVDELKDVLARGDKAHLQDLFESTFPSVARRARESRRVMEDERKEGGGGGEGGAEAMLQTTMTQVGLPEDERRRRAREKERAKAREMEREKERDREEREKERVQGEKKKGRGRPPRPPRGGGRGGRGGRGGGYAKQKVISNEQSTLLQQHMDQDQVSATLDRVFREVNSCATTQLNVLLRCMDWVDIQGRGHRLLEEYRPAFIVLYDADLAFVRQVEVYKASLPGRPVRMYLLSFDDSAEEARFRHASAREKDAFKTLIRERATMTVLSDQEGRQQPQQQLDNGAVNVGKEADLQLQFTQRVLSASGRRGLGTDRDSRLKPAVIAGGNASSSGVDVVAKQSVIVDTRELRSSLPMLLHQTGITIVPVTLEVADFVLSDDIGIERKSLPDLQGSFGSGRLFNQADALCRHYKHPCLLIELDANRPLSLAALSGGVPHELHATSILSKLVLLVQQFPMLCLLWAKGPHDAAALFKRLKANQAEPDVDAAAKLGVDSSQTEDREFNAGPKALLRSLPGIDSQNINRVMRKVRNVSTLVTMTKDEMTQVLGSAAKAAKLFNFVNEKPSEALAAL